MLALLGLALAVTLRPPPVEGADVRLYRVHGRDVQAVDEAMFRRSPYVDTRGVRHHAGMTYRLRWRWKPQGDGTCRVLPPRTHVQVTLPRVRTRPSVEDHVADYLAAVVVHEQGHVDRVWEGVRALEAELARIPNGPCGAVGEAVAREGKAAVASIHASNARYDRETGHGATQGARL